jgi:hypothetical protein
LSLRIDPIGDVPRIQVTVTHPNDDLLASAPLHAPLAEQLRPQRLDDVIGQRHLLGPGKPLRLGENGPGSNFK